MRLADRQRPQISRRDVPEPRRPLATTGLWLGTIAAISLAAVQAAIQQQWVVFALLIVCALLLVGVLIVTGTWSSAEDVDDTIVNGGHGVLLVWAIFLTVKVIIFGVDSNWWEFGLGLFAALWSWATLCFARLGFELPDPSEFGLPT